MSTSTKPLALTITRTVKAPRDLVFACWTEDEHLARWQGAPKGMTAAVDKKEIRPGGEYRIRLLEANGTEHRVQGRYLEVVRPERLVFTHAWLDADGHPGHETMVTITFTEADGRTTMTLHQEGFMSSASRDGHAEGWGSQMDRFITYVQATTNAQ